MDVERVLRLARISLRLGEVERVPTHPDGRRETDTTHTVMLALLAAEAADELGLDVGRAVLFALVHDLVEVYAGDTDTSQGLSGDERALKRAREHAAAQRLDRELPGSVLVRALADYEDRQEDEARLVHLLDKMCPKAVSIVGIEDGGHPRTAASYPRAIQQALELAQECPGPFWAPLHELASGLRLRLFDAAEVPDVQR